MVCLDCIECSATPVINTDNQPLSLACQFTVHNSMRWEAQGLFEIYRGGPQAQRRDVSGRRLRKELVAQGDNATMNETHS